MKRTKKRWTMAAMGILLAVLPVAAINCDVVGYDPCYWGCDVYYDVYDVYYVDYYDPGYYVW